MVFTYKCFRYETWKKYSVPFQRKQRSDRFTADVISTIQNFYVNHSTILPMTKTCTVGKVEKQKAILNKTTRKLYKDFLSEHTRSVSLSMFRKLRPKHILPVDAHRFRTCLCETCLNLSYKAQALKAAGIPGVNDKYDLLDMSMCTREGTFNRPECVHRSCSSCGVQNLEDDLKRVPLEGMQKWRKWETDGLTKRKVQVEKSGSYSDLVKETMGELETFSVHMHNALWQQQQYRTLRDNLPEKWVVSVQDFAENFRHSNQDEIASAYFGYTQTSLLTNVSSYHCPTCSERIDESVVFITSDLKHDSYVVKSACDQLALHLQDKGISAEKHVIFSDGCSQQFKSKVPFSILVDKNTERCFFGSQHGKSQCDALGGIVKKAATRFVASTQGTIRSAEELYDYCSKELTTVGNCREGKHKIRSFFLLRKIERPNELPNLIPVRNTRKIHSVRNVGEGMIKTKQLSCYCDVCTGQKNGVCPWVEYTGEWTGHNLNPTTESKKKVTLPEQTTKCGKAAAGLPAMSAEAVHRIAEGSGRQDKDKTDKVIFLFITHCMFGDGCNFDYLFTH